MDRSCSQHSPSAATTPAAHASATSSEAAAAATKSATTATATPGPDQLRQLGVDNLLGLGEDRHKILGLGSIAGGEQSVAGACVAFPASTTWTEKLLKLVLRIMK